MQNFSKVISIILFFIMTVSFTGCNNLNPNVEKDRDKTSYEVYDENSEPTQNNDVFKEIDLDTYANRSYELKFLIAQESFKSPEEISVNAIVQYAFSHLYYENLCEMPQNGISYRSATEAEIRKEIEKHFGPLDINIKDTYLYNKGNDKFEMWEPNYGTDIFYDVEGQLLAEGGYRVKTVFYTDDVKDKILATTFLTLNEYKGKIIIKSFNSKQG